MYWNLQEETSYRIKKVLKINFLFFFSRTHLWSSTWPALPEELGSILAASTTLSCCCSPERAAIYQFTQLYRFIYIYLLLILLTRLCKGLIARCSSALVAACCSISIGIAVVQFKVRCGWWALWRTTAAYIAGVQLMFATGPCLLLPSTLWWMIGLAQRGFVDLANVHNCKGTAVAAAAVAATAAVVAATVQR